MSRWEIRLSGFGGQGVVSAGHIIAKAAALYEDGKDAVLTRAYGPEKTGGWARADVIVADGEVDYPLVEAPDIFVAMSQDGFDRDAASAKPDATILIDQRLVDASALTGPVILPVPAVEEAEALGKRVVANIVMLGAFTITTGIVTPEAMERAVLETVPKGTEELNARAFQRGLALAKETKGQGDWMTRRPII